MKMATGLLHETLKDRDALLTFYDFPAEPPAISGGAGLEHRISPILVDS
jgi:hypothetical protein